jgi:predicted Ser/Thr protein kinase
MDDTIQTSRDCKRCGAPAPVNSPEGLCPKCLMNEAMAPDQTTIDSNPTGGKTAAPSIDEITKYFPQLEIIELLGSGGMGIVYKARQPQLDRLIALKLLPVEAGRNPAFAERFSREARALAKLNHPGIVAIYDFGQAGPYYFFAMQYVDGCTLQQLIRAKKITPREALGIVTQICEALQFAHDEGVVHRDIKPGNILLDKRGRVRIADFGLAKLLGQAPADFSLTASHVVMGTPHYMAPEQMEHPQEVDHRADIYSLGVVFYEMLTGDLPLGRFAPPSQKVQIDVRLDEVVLHALESEPDRRYQTAIAVKNDVDTIAGEPAETAIATENPNAAEAPLASQTGSEKTPERKPRPTLFWTKAFVLLCLGWLFAAAMWNYRNSGMTVAIFVLSGILCWLAVWRVPSVAGNRGHWSKSSRRMQAWLVFNAMTGALLGFFFLFSAAQNDWERATLHWNRSGVTDAEFEQKYKGKEYQLLRQLRAFRQNVPNVELQLADGSWSGGWHIWGESGPHNRLFGDSSVWSSLFIALLGLLLAPFGIFAPPHYFKDRFSWDVIRASFALAFCVLLSGVLCYLVLVIRSFYTDPVFHPGLVATYRGIICDPPAPLQKVEAALREWAGRHGYAIGDRSRWYLATVPQGNQIAQTALFQLWKPSPYDRWKMNWRGLHRISPHVVVECTSSEKPAETHINITPGERLPGPAGETDPWTAELLDLKKTLSAVSDQTKPINDK